MPTPSSKLGKEIENVLYWVQLEQLGASAVRSPLPTDCRCRRNEFDIELKVIMCWSIKISNPVYWGEVGLNYRHRTAI